MKKRNIILVVALLLLWITIDFAGIINFTAGGEFEIGNSGITHGKVTASVLNIRQGISMNMPVIYKAHRNEIVKIFGRIEDWYVVYIPDKKLIGAAVSSYIDIINKKQPVADVQQPAVKSVTASLLTGNDDFELPGDISDDEKELLDLVNHARQQKNVSILKCDAKLTTLARIKANDMVNKDYFSHESPTYGSPFDMMKQFGISFKYAGENIAGNISVRKAFDALISSEEHKKNILNHNYGYTGIAVVPSNVYGNIIVQVFMGK